MNPRVVALVVIALIAGFAGLFDLKAGRESTGELVSDITHPTGFFTRIGNTFSSKEHNLENVEIHATLTYDSIKIPFEFSEPVELSISLDADSRLHLDKRETASSDPVILKAGSYAGTLLFADDLASADGQVSVISLGSLSQKASTFKMFNQSYSVASVRDLGAKKISLESVSGSVRIIADNEKVTFEITDSPLVLTSFTGDLIINPDSNALTIDGRGSLQTSVFQTTKADSSKAKKA